MRKRIIAYLLSVIMALSIFPVSAYAVEKTDEKSEISSSAISGYLSQDPPAKPVSFSKEEADSVLNGEEDGAITIGEMISLMDITYSHSMKHQKEFATVYDFLYEFVSHYKGRFLHYNGESFLYPAGDSMWMSAGEWSYLVDHLNCQIKRSSVKIIMNRTDECAKYIKTHHIPDDYQRYEDMIDGFYREFLQLVKDNQSAVKYWLNPSGDDTLSIYNNGDFSAVLHELQHESSARKSNVFQKRRVEGNKWRVYYNTKPSTFYYYDITTQEWLSSKRMDLPNSSVLMSKGVSPEIKKSELYRCYISGNTSSNEWGLYGMLFEFCSAEIGLRADVISTSINYHYKELPAHTQKVCYFWEGAILHYLYCLQEKNPSTYSKIMENQTILTLLDHLFSYTREQIALAPFVAREDEELLVMKSWAEDETAQAQKAEIAAHLSVTDIADLPGGNTATEY